MKKSFLLTIGSLFVALIAFNAFAQDADVIGASDQVLIGKVTALITVVVVMLEQILPYLPTKFNSITQGILQFLRRFLPKKSDTEKK